MNGACRASTTHGDGYISASPAPSFSLGATLNSYLHHGGGISSTGVGNKFSGKIYGFKIWRRTESFENEIQAMAAGDYTRSNASLVGDYAMDEGTGSTFADDSGVGADAHSTDTVWTSGFEPRVINLIDTQYAAVREVTITPLGNTPKIGIADNIILGFDCASFCAYVFNLQSSAVRSDFKWYWRGV